MTYGVRKKGDNWSTILGSLPVCYFVELIGTGLCLN